MIWAGSYLILERTLGLFQMNHDQRSAAAIHLTAALTLIADVLVVKYFGYFMFLNPWFFSILILPINVLSGAMSRSQYLHQKELHNLKLNRNHPGFFPRTPADNRDSFGPRAGKVKIGALMLLIAFFGVVFAVVHEAQRSGEAAALLMLVGLIFSTVLGYFVWIGFYFGFESLLARGQTDSALQSMFARDQQILRASALATSLVLFADAWIGFKFFDVIIGNGGIALLVLAPINLIALMNTAGAFANRNDHANDHLSWGGRNAAQDPAGDQVKGRRNFLRSLLVGGGLLSIGQSARAQTKTKKAPTPGTQRTLVPPEMVNGLYGFLDKMRTPQLFVRSIAGPVMTQDWAFLYDNAAVSQSRIARKYSKEDLQAAASLLSRIQKRWPRHPRTFMRDKFGNEKPLPAWVRTANAETGAIVEPEQYVDSGPILHVGMAAINAYKNAQRVDAKNLRSYDFLLEIAEEAADYALALTHTNGLVRHGPLGDGRDWPYNTATCEHQWEAQFVWKELVSLKRPRAEIYRRAAEKNLQVSFATFWNRQQLRFHGSFNLETNELSPTLPTDVQAWPLSMIGVEEFLKHVSLADLYRHFAILDKEHAVRDEQWNLLGYDYVPQRGELVSIEWSWQVINARLLLALYLKQHPGEARTAGTSWQQQAALAYSVAQRLSKIKRGSTHGLPYAADAAGNIAADKPTGHGWNTQSGESTISGAYTAAAGRGFDIALPGGRMEGQAQMLAELTDENIRAAEQLTRQFDGNLLTQKMRGYHETPEFNAMAVYYEFPKAIRVPSGGVRLRFTLPKGKQARIELVQDHEKPQDVSELFKTSPVGTGQVQEFYWHLPKDIHLRRVVFQIGANDAHGAIPNPAWQIENPEFSIEKDVSAQAGMRTGAIKNQGSERRKFLSGVGLGSAMGAFWRAFALRKTNRERAHEKAPRSVPEAERARLQSLAAMVVANLSIANRDIAQLTPRRLATPKISLWTRCVALSAAVLAEIQLLHGAPRPHVDLRTNHSNVVTFVVDKGTTRQEIAQLLDGSVASLRADLHRAEEGGAPPHLNVTFAIPEPLTEQSELTKKAVEEYVSNHFWLRTLPTAISIDHELSLGRHYHAARAALEEEQQFDHEKYRALYDITEGNLSDLNGTVIATGGMPYDADEALAKFFEVILAGAKVSLSTALKVATIALRMA